MRTCVSRRAFRKLQIDANQAYRRILLMVARKKRTPVVASAMSRPQQVSKNLDAAGKDDNDDEEGYGSSKSNGTVKLR